MDYQLISKYSLQFLVDFLKNNWKEEAIALFQKLRVMNVKLNIVTNKIMVSKIFKSRNIEEARDLFASSISVNGPVR